MPLRCTAESSGMCRYISEAVQTSGPFAASTEVDETWQEVSAYCRLTRYRSFEL